MIIFLRLKKWMGIANSSNKRYFAIKKVDFFTAKYLLVDLFPIPNHFFNCKRIIVFSKQFCHSKQKKREN